MVNEPDASPRYDADLLAELEATVASIDPLLVEASYEQDLALLRWHLSLTPDQRIRASSRAAHLTSTLRRAR